MNVTVRQLFGRDEEHGRSSVSRRGGAAAAAAAVGGSGDREDDAVAGGDRGGLCARLPGPVGAGHRRRRRGFRSAGLADLLGPSAGEVVSKLPPVQRRALEAACSAGESAPPADERVAAAFLGSVRLLAAAGPLCVAVDDVQWLDGASLAALRFALSRLDDEPRSPHRRPGRRAGGLRRAVPEQRRRTIQVGGLSVGAIHELLRVRLHATFARPTLLRIWETSRGNPLRARAGSCAPAPGRHASGRAAPVPLRPRPAPAGAPRRPQPRGARGYPRGRRACRPDHAARRGCRRAAGLDRHRRGARSADPRAGRERLRFTTRCSPRSAAVKRPFAAGAARAARAARPHGGGTGPSPRPRHGRAELRDRRRARGCRPSGVEPRRSHHCRGRRAGTQAHAAAARADARRRLFLAADIHHTVGDSARATTLLTRARGGRTRRRAGRGARPARGCAVRATRAQAPLRAGARRGGRGMTASRRQSTSGSPLHALGEGVSRGMAHADLAVRAASRTDDVALRCRAPRSTRTGS